MPPTAEVKGALRSVSAVLSKATSSHGCVADELGVHSHDGFRALKVIRLHECRPTASCSTVGPKSVETQLNKQLLGLKHIRRLNARRLLLLFPLGHVRTNY
jgi:hypothetical protein